MTKNELQKLIDYEGKNPADMRKIGVSYLKGDVLRDHVAAEGWLMKVIEAEDEVESVLAMELIARELLGKEQVISDQDYVAMKRELEKSGKNKQLELLMSFATENQRKL